MKHIKKLIIFTLILFIGLNFIYATDNTTSPDNIITQQTDTTNQNTIQEKNNPIQNEEKTIIKENKTLKKESKTIILNSSTFDTYVTNRTFNDEVSEGDTIDIQGILDGGRFSLNITKAINIISSTHDAYIDVNTRSAGFYGSDANDYAFVISNGGSGSNVSDLTFHNTHIYTTNAQNITITNITADCNQAVGVGRGMISIRDGSKNITIRNSYFETFDNGGHSNVVFAYAHDCLFENNTVKGNGIVGNLIYATTYGSADDTGEIDVDYGNWNITIRNNYIDGLNATDNGICVGLALEGINHTIENNTILKRSMAIIAQVNDYGTTIENITFKDNYIPYGSVIQKENCTYINNYIGYKTQIINDTNYADYGEIINETLYITNHTLTQNPLVITATQIDKVYSDYSLNLIYVIPTIKEITLSNQSFSINNLYAPNTTITMNSQGIINNSILKSVYINNSGQNNITNNIIINYDGYINEYIASILCNNENNNKINISNNYLLTYTNNEIIQSDESIKNIQTNNIITENNTPNYKNIHLLNNQTYDELFDENNTLREEITGIILLNETINKSIIINKPITLTTQKTTDKNITYFNKIGENNQDRLIITVPKTINRYNNITFTDGAQYSNLIDSYTNNINLNTNNINIQNNNINGNITLTNSNNNTITNNKITSNDTYTINIDNSSNNNTIENNTLNAKIYKGDLSVYNTQENSINNNIPLNNVNISVECNVLPMKPTTLKINITFNNEPVNEGYVIVNIVNGTQITKENLTDGYIELNYTFTKNETLKVWYFGEKNFNKTSFTKNITVTKSNITLALDYTNITIGETININATVFDQYNNPLDNETLTFIVNNTEHNISITNGTVIFTAKTNDTWVNGVYAKFYETDTYNTIQSSTFKLEKGEVIFNIIQKVEDNKLKITIYLTDIGGSPVTSGYIRFRNGTKAINNSKIADGFASCEISLSDSLNGSVILANFTNNGAFNLRAENITLTTNPPVTTHLHFDKINGEIGQETVITTIIVSDDNSTVNEGTVTFTTTNYTQTIQVTNGTASTTHTFTQTLNDTITATYTPTNPENYYESTNTTTITISKDPENITITLTPITANINEETTITATITTENSTPVNEGTVTFTTTNYTQTIQVTNGTASTTHTFTQTLNDTITATYTPTNPENYNPQTNTTIITITEQIKELTLKIDTTNFTIGQTTTIKASIYQEDILQTNITGGKVVFKVNGKTLKDTKNKVIYAKVEKGVAKIENFTIPETWNNENLTIQAIYSGYKEYKTLKSQKTPININKATPTLTTENINTTLSGTITLKATVTDNDNIINTGKIVFKINGKTVKDANGKVIYAKVVNNTVSVEYTLPDTYKAKEYTITATFIATGYDKLTDEKTLKITA